MCTLFPEKGHIPVDVQLDEFSQREHSHAAGIQIKKQNISPQAPSCPTLPVMTFDFYHPWLVLPSFGPPITRITQCVLLGVYLFKCVFQICSYCGVQLIWDPFWMFIRCHHSVRFLKRLVHLLQNTPLSFWHTCQACVGGRASCGIGPGFGSQLCHFLVVWLEAASLAAPSLSFRTCTVERIIKPNSWGCGDVSWRSCVWRIKPVRGPWVWTVAVDIQKTWPRVWHTGHMGDGAILAMLRSRRWLCKFYIAIFFLLRKMLDMKNKTV